MNEKRSMIRSSGTYTATDKLGSAGALVRSMVMSLVLEYLCGAEDYAALSLTCRTFEQQAKRFFTAVEIADSDLHKRHGGPPRDLVVDRPFTLWLDDVATFTRRLRRLVNDESPIAAAVAAIRGPLFPVASTASSGDDDVENVTIGHDETRSLDIEGSNDTTPGRSEDEESAPFRALRKSFPTWEDALGLRSAARRRLGLPALTSRQSNDITASTSASALSPSHLVIRNVVSLGYDSDGVTPHWDLDGTHLPFTLATMHLFDHIQTITISQFPGALESFVDIWEHCTTPRLRGAAFGSPSLPAASIQRGRPSTTWRLDSGPDGSRLPVSTDEVASSATTPRTATYRPFPCLVQLTMHWCSVPEPTAARALQLPMCATSLRIEGPFSMSMAASAPASTRSHTSNTVSPMSSASLVLDRDKENHRRWGPLAAVTEPTGCQRLHVDSITTSSPLPWSPFLTCIRIRSLEVLEPSAWYLSHSSTLTRLHIDAVVVDKQVASLDLDFSRWAALKDVYVGHCDSITALQPSPQLLSLHLHQCVLHVRGAFCSPGATLQFTDCVGASKKLDFEALHITARNWTGRPAVFRECVDGSHIAHAEQL